jgi:dTDP-4-dehydrorhamnose reductase
LAQHVLPDILIVRTAFYSLGTPGKHSLAAWVAEGLKKGDTLNMFTDVFFSPIPASTLAQVILEMDRKELGGLYHIGGRERCSKYAFGQALARALGLDTTLIQPSMLADVNLKAPRPRDVSLNVDKTLGVLALPDLAEGISQMLKEAPALTK